MQVQPERALSGEERGGCPMIDLEQFARPRRMYGILRRAWDIALSLLVLAVLWPFMLLVAAAIWIDSPGASPVFVQERIGCGGKPFPFLKFRSMVPGAEERIPELLAYNEMDGPVFKIRDDPRITRVGRFIRRTCIDELPQLINVLAGDMSIVGPRPALPREVAQYTAYERQRLFVKPGLTCYWQIQPDRNALSFAEWMELDIRYVRERGFATDWRIMLRTVRAVLQMNGE